MQLRQMKHVGIALILAFSTSVAVSPAFGNDSEARRDIRSKVFSNSVVFEMRQRGPKFNKKPAKRINRPLTAARPQRLTRKEVVSSLLPWCMRRGSLKRFTPVGFWGGAAGDNFAEVAPIMDMSFKFVDCPDRPQAKRVARQAFSESELVNTATRRFGGTGFEFEPVGRHDVTMPVWLRSGESERSVVLRLGQVPVRVHFRALQREFDLGDGGPVLRCGPVANPSFAQFQSGSCKRKFANVGEFVFKMKTDWEVSYRDPFTGEIKVLSQRLKTEEVSPPQVVKVFHTVLTDDAEERNGH